MSKPLAALPVDRARKTEAYLTQAVAELGRERLASAESFVRLAPATDARSTHATALLNRIAQLKKGR
jgi:hypothetical protein